MASAAPGDGAQAPPGAVPPETVPFFNKKKPKGRFFVDNTSAPRAANRPTMAPKRGEICMSEGCTSKVQSRGLCARHGAFGFCQHPGCTKHAVAHGVCFRHGGKGWCSEPGCKAPAESRKKCRKHGAFGFCRVPGCGVAAVKRSLCQKHGAKGYCSFEGCTTAAIARGLCRKHGGKRVLCKQEDCNNVAVARGKCKRHGALPVCSEPGCTTRASGRGLCSRHGGRGFCRFEGCNNAARARNLCALHGGIPKCRVMNCETKVYVRGKCKKHLAQFGSGDADIQAGMADPREVSTMTNAEAADLVLSDSDTDDYGPRSKRFRTKRKDDGMLARRVREPTDEEKRAASLRIAATAKNLSPDEARNVAEQAMAKKEDPSEQPTATRSGRSSARTAATAAAAAANVVTAPSATPVATISAPPAPPATAAQALAAGVGAGTYAAASGDMRRRVAAPPSKDRVARVQRPGTVVAPPAPLRATKRSAEPEPGELAPRSKARLAKVVAEYGSSDSRAGSAVVQRRAQRGPPAPKGLVQPPPHASPVSRRQAAMGLVTMRDASSKK